MLILSSRKLSNRDKEKKTSLQVENPLKSFIFHPSYRFSAPPLKPPQLKYHGKNVCKSKDKEKSRFDLFFTSFIGVNIEFVQSFCLV